MQRSAKNALLQLRNEPFVYVGTRVALSLIRDGYVARATVESRHPPRGKLPVSITAKGRGWLVRQQRAVTQEQEHG